MSNDRAPRLAAFLWRRLTPLQWRLVRLRQHTFLVAAQVLVRDGQGRLLLLRHRWWPPDRQWGLPGGYAEAGERLEDAARREVREETGLAIEVGAVLHLRSGFRSRVEVVFAGELADTSAAAGPAAGPDVAPGRFRLDHREILEAAFVAPSDLPPGIMPEHRALIEQHAAWITQTS